MASLSPEFKLTLGAARPTSSESISSIIQRINTERGGFLGITEESLLQEIAEVEAGDDGDESSSSEEEEEEPDKLKELMAARDEIIGQIEYRGIFLWRHSTNE
jgi:mediator of RNA polymerase II transcription subunit 17